MGVLETGREDAVSVAADATVGGLARATFDRSIDSVLVEDDGRPEGIITDRNVVEPMTGSGATVFEDASAAADPTAQDVVTVDPVLSIGSWRVRRASGRLLLRPPRIGGDVIGPARTATCT